MIDLDKKTNKVGHPMPTPMHQPSVHPMPFFREDDSGNQDDAGPENGQSLPEGNTCILFTMFDYTKKLLLRCTIMAVQKRHQSTAMGKRSLLLHGTMQARPRKSTYVQINEI